MTQTASHKKPIILAQFSPVDIKFEDMKEANDSEHDTRNLSLNLVEEKKISSPDHSKSSSFNEVSVVLEEPIQPIKTSVSHQNKEKGPQMLVPMEAKEVAVKKAESVVAPSEIVKKEAKVIETTVKSSEFDLPPSGHLSQTRKVDQARSDLTFRTYGPKPYTKKETFQTTAPAKENSLVMSLARENTFPSAKEVVHKDPVEVKHVELSESKSFSPQKEQESLKSISKTPDLRTNRPNNNILLQAEPKKVKSSVLFKSPGDKTKKHSTFSLQSSEDMSGSEPISAPDDGLLQRRNSIHNVPYVDVNDPATRERMERYKEERRSMLRLKFRVEDYREKAPAGNRTILMKDTGNRG